MRTCVMSPTAPVRLTARPGTSRSTSETMRVWRSCRSCSVITVADSPRSSAETGSPEREAVTTTSATLASADGGGATATWA